MVPVKTVQLSPAFAKLTTGLMTSVRKLIVMTWPAASVYAVDVQQRTGFTYVNPGVCAPWMASARVVGVASRRCRALTGAVG